MDFKTTEASEDLGGLVRTITESVCTPERQRELDAIEPRDHVLFLGEVDEIELSDRAPLLFHDSAFHRIGERAWAKPAVTAYGLRDLAIAAVGLVGRDTSVPPRADALAATRRRREAR